jgi:hypothetical protein
LALDVMLHWIAACALGPNLLGALSAILRSGAPERCTDEWN